jgi:type I restriction enzyme, S subunit
MAIKKRSKKTAIGEIPEDWDFRKIEQDIDLQTGFPFPSNKYAKAGIRLLRGSNVKRNSTDWSEDITQYWEKLSPEITQYALQKDDIVIAMDGSLVGRSFAQLKEKDLPALLLQRVARIRSNKVDIGYLKEYVCSEYFTKYCDKVKTASAIPHISPGDIKNFSIPIPPTCEEQAVIATTLSDTDALISGLEKLTIKKRNIKEGALRELLQTISNSKLNALQDVCWFQEGPGLRNWQFTKRGIKVINVTNLINGFLKLDNTDRHISLDEFNNTYKHFGIDENDILVASSGNSYGKVAVVRAQDLPLVMNTSVIRFKPLNGICYNFLLLFLKSKEFKKQIDSFITGGAQPNFGPAHLKKVKINMPDSIKEQERVSAIIFDMETEIYALETKLQKYRQIKAGMMQTLLTGQIRLL